MLEHCDVCRAFEKVPRGPIAATSAASTLNEKLRADLLFLDDALALRAADVYSKYFSVMPARPRNPRRVRDACRSGWIGVFRQLFVKVVYGRTKCGRIFARGSV